MTSLRARWKTVEVSNRRLLVWGAADQCRVNYPILKALGCSVEVLVDDTPDKKTPFREIPLLTGHNDLDAYIARSRNSSLGFVLAIGNPYGHVRVRLQRELIAKGFTPVSFADSTALICQSVIYGYGLQVMPMAIIHTDARIGEQCIVNTRALVEHDCILEDGVEIGPGAVLCGRVAVGRNTWIGANATVGPRIRIGANTIIGAGAVVMSDIPNNVVAFGVPAKVIRENLIYE